MRMSTKTEKVELHTRLAALAMAVLVISGLLLLLVAFAIGDLALGVRIVLTPCVTEDQVAPDCYLDADTRGNHQGTSFVMIDGHIYYDEGEVTP